MKSRYSTHIGIFFINIIARFPFWLIFFFSGLFFIITYYIVGYRKKVVFNNLKNAFPEKSGDEIKIISKKFFRHFCDFTLETIKMKGMKAKDFEKRMIVTNPELLNTLFDEGKNAIALTMHYNNWEWGTFLSMKVKHKVLAVYKPLHNHVFDEYMNKIRSRFGMELVRNDQFLKRIIKAAKQKELVVSWFAGDQTPPVFHKSWFRFLNQDALFYLGPAIISKRFNLPVIFQYTEKKGRGIYHTTLEMLVENPATLKEEEIIDLYIRRMEKLIREQPEYYLWSHKRWKHKKPEDIPLQN